MISSILIMLLVLWVCIYSFSYGVWVWKKGNRFGAFVVMCTSLLAFVLPAVILFTV